jgi:hypothetical protein
MLSRRGKFYLDLLKQASQIKSEIVISKHNLQQEINMQGFSTRLCINLLLTNLIKDIPHYSLQRHIVVQDSYLLKF